MTDQPAPPDVVLEDKPCPMGCPQNDEVVLEGRDRLTGGPGVFRVVRCRQCGLARTNPRPTPETIGAYYPADYPSFHYDGGVAEDLGVLRARNRAWPRRVLRRLGLRSRRLPDVAPGRLLEIGCGTGDFLVQAAIDGWQVEGLEFSQSAADFARRRGFSVMVGQLEDSELGDARYDAVAGWMVLEHLHDPVGALRLLHRAVRPGGWLAASVPNFGSWDRRLFGAEWFALQLPGHLFHYTPATLRALLEANGWEVVWIGHQRNLGNWMCSLGWSLQDRRILPGLGRRLAGFPDWSLPARLPFVPLAWLMGILGQSGRMNVIARRKP